jgi:hypothetical protein
MPEQDHTFEREGVAPMPGGMNLYFYLDPGVYIYRLELVGHGIIMERIFNWADDPGAREVLDGAKEQWQWAQHAHEHGEDDVAIAFTWRGLCLIFPDLPAEPLDEEQSNGP